ncbi:retrovirus-related pol polyprotein from transposon TNT 1-94 [Tanacetum coccineum]|uniref:Retrovirus-related pol polyprotein from transposon TNT 1-94 n=1 Tax=Tanacetum coccineum TaxID=301880 RepID=A0ABQ4WNQ7_9ASTR
MELYIENRENGRMILNSVQNGPRVWLIIVQEDGTTRTKKSEELSVAEKLQADCDLKANNIILQGLPPDVYAIVNHHKVAKEIWDRVKLLMQGTKLSLQEKECTLFDEFDKFSFVKGLAVYVFTQGDDPTACLKKAMAFLSAVVALSRVTVQQIQGRQGQSYIGTGNKGEGHMARQCTQSKRPMNAAWFMEKAMLAEAQETNAYDSDCDDVSTTQAVLMASLSNYGSDVISEVPHFESYHNDMDNQIVHAMQDFEQTPVVDFPDNEITSDRNIIMYSQYLQEIQHAAVQDTNLYAQHDSMILSLIEQMSKQMINHVNSWEKANQEKNKESLTAELERYKEREKFALKQQNLSNQIKEKESLLQTFTIFKNESKEKESKYIDKEIDLEKKIKKLDNIVYKVGPSAQRPTLYDGSVISSQHVVIPMIDDEETLILEELQVEDTIIPKLKEHIKSMRENDKEENVKQDMDEIETINIELKHNSFDSIKKTRASSKEHNDSLIAQLNSKSLENADLKGQIQEKVFVTTALQNELRRVKGKNMLDNATTITNATTIIPGIFKLDLDPLAPRLLTTQNPIILEDPMLQMFHLLLLLSMTCCLDWSLVSGLCMLKTYEREPLSAHELRSRDTNLYTISLDDKLKTSPICLLSKALNTKSWLWNRRISHLNFGTLNKLAKDGLARGISKLKFKKDHLCSACALGKSNKSSHQPKANNTNQEKLYLLHMDLCSPILKDEALDAIIKCIKNIRVRLNATICNVRKDNGTEFVNQTLREFYENVSISDQTSVARTPQQNDVVKRRNQTLVEAARTMLIF